VPVEAAPTVNPHSTVAAAVALTTLAQIGTVMGIAVFPVLAPRLAAELGVEHSIVGYQMSLIYGAAAVSSPFLWWMVTRRGACGSYTFTFGLLTLFALGSIVFLLLSAAGVQRAAAMESRD
jgi:hypothetical protein